MTFPPAPLEMPAPASGTAPLPIPSDLCERLGLAAEEIAFLINPANRHYDSYARKKRNGGVRRIDEPKPRMKRAQRVIYEKILSPLELHDAAHGFRNERSVLTAASPHAGKGVLVTADVASFFPTIRARRVAGLFRKLGFAEDSVSVLTRLTTYRGRLPQKAVSPLTGASLSAALKRLPKR